MFTSPHATPSSACNTSLLDFRVLNASLAQASLDSSHSQLVRRISVSVEESSIKVGAGRGGQVGRGGSAAIRRTRQDEEGGERTLCVLLLQSILPHATCYMPDEGRRGTSEGRASFGKMLTLPDLIQSCEEICRRFIRRFTHLYFECLVLLQSKARRIFVAADGPPTKQSGRERKREVKRFGVEEDSSLIVARPYRGHPAVVERGPRVSIHPSPRHNFLSPLIDCRRREVSLSVPTAMTVEHACHAARVEPLSWAARVATDSGRQDDGRNDHQTTKLMGCPCSEFQVLRSTRPCAEKSGSSPLCHCIGVDMAGAV